MNSKSKARNPSPSRAEPSAGSGTSSTRSKLRQQLTHGVTHCLMDLRKTLRPVLDRPSSLQDCSVGDVLDMFGRAEKFLMPQDGLLFEDTDASHFLKFFKLPFKEVVLEYTGTTGDYRAVPKNNDERVQVVMLAKETATETDAAPGVMVCVAYQQQSYPANWILMPPAIFIPYDTTAGEWKADITKSLAAPLYPWRKVIYFDNQSPTEQDAGYDICIQAVVKESLALFHFCNAVNCSNVIHETVKAPTFINLKRREKGLLPLYEYKILTVDTRPRNEAGEPTGKHHASPRQHIRRGTLRHYKSGKTTWVNSMVVGDPKLGRIDKDYEIKK